MTPVPPMLLFAFWCDGGGRYEAAAALGPGAKTGGIANARFAKQLAANEFAAQ